MNELDQSPRIWAFRREGIAIWITDDVPFPSEKLPKATIRFTVEQKRSVKMLATSLNTTIQDFTMACYNAGYALMGLDPLDPGCPIELPRKTRPKQGGA